MSEVKWQPLAMRHFRQAVTRGLSDFGPTTASSMIDEVDRIVLKLEKQPGAGYLKLVSSGKKRLYRACLVKKRFELIYYYQESTDTVFVADFWDAKMNPDKLERRLGNI